MTKQEVIQQAYGEYWEQAKEFIKINKIKLAYKDIFIIFALASNPVLATN